MDHGLRRVRCLVAIAVLASAAPVSAQRGVRMVYNPVTGQTEPEARRPTHRVAPDQAVGVQASAERRPPAPRASRQPEATPAERPIAADAIRPASHVAPCECGEGGCFDCSTAPCGEIVLGQPGCGDVVACGYGRFFAGFEFTFVKPRFDSNVAYTLTESDGVGNSVITDVEFDYDMELTPRVHVGWLGGDGVGFRATWWQFDNNTAIEGANPPANGFGSIDHPPFGAVEAGSSVPTDVFTAASDLNAYAIDFEITKETTFCGWDLGVAGGLRYAVVEQGYLAERRNASATLIDRIDYSQAIEGFGPTISLGATRPITYRMSLYCKARASILFGDGDSRMSAGEDLDMTTPFTTVRTTSRDDLLSIGEIQVGLQWRGDGAPGGVFRPFASVALEGQVWNGAGSATSEDGTLGFFGLNTGVGVDW